MVSGALVLFLHCIIHATYSEIWRFPKETGKIDKMDTFYKKYQIIPELKSKYIKGSRGLMGATSTKGSSTTRTSISKTEAKLYHHTHVFHFSFSASKATFATLEFQREAQQPWYLLRMYPRVLILKNSQILYCSWMFSYHICISFSLCLNYNFSFYDAILFWGCSVSKFFLSFAFCVRFN